MCGIAGVLGPEFSVAPAHLEMMGLLLSHRGPDAQGYWLSESCDVGFVHTRLSILDLDQRANQPMHSKCGRYVVIFNGEIYNYRKIARNLHLNLSTTSDTEVLLEAFALIGPECFSQFNGMMAAAIWDKIENKLFLARDRLGKKPLFYTFKEGKFVFASELKAILACVSGLAPNLQALSYFLHLGYIPQPFTAFDGIYKFPSANWAIVQNNELQLYPYWDSGSLVESEPMKISEVEAMHHLAILLEDSVRLRMNSDVPFGAFLSGGIDSSLVTFLAANQYSEKLKTFTIGFKESDKDESRWAEKVAQHLQTDHKTFILSEKEAAKRIPEILSIYDEPFADSSSIPTLLISELASREVKMVLTGEGGDELFGGYGSYRWALRLQKPFWKYFHKPLSFILSFGSDRMRRISKLLDYGSETWMPGHIFSQEQYFFSAREIGTLSNLLPTPTAFSLTQTSRELNAAEKQAFFDLNYYLRDDLLVKVDRATMRYGLEARCPILDYRVVEFALNLPFELKFGCGQLKYFLKQTLFNFVPEEFFQRPKQGFSIPLDRWLKGELKFILDDNLDAVILKKYELVNPDHIKNLRLRFDAGHNHLYNRLWAVAQLHQFMRKHF